MQTGTCPTVTYHGTIRRLHACLSTMNVNDVFARGLRLVSQCCQRQDLSSTWPPQEFQSTLARRSVHVYYTRRLACVRCRRREITTEPDLLYDDAQNAFNLSSSPRQHSPIQRITFKTAVLVYKCLHGMARPQYLQMYCEPTSTGTSRRLRSAHSGRLTVPRTRTNYGDRSFAVQGPRAWNSLPAELRAPDITLATFRNRLDTFLSQRICSFFPILRYINVLLLLLLLLLITIIIIIFSVHLLLLTTTTVGVTLTNRFSTSEHVTDIIGKCAQSLYALKVLRCHGMGDDALMIILGQSCLPRYCMRRPRGALPIHPTNNEVEPFIRRCVRLNFYRQDDSTADQLVADLDAGFVCCCFIERSTRSSLYFA